MIYLILYVFLYCNADVILNNLYLSKFTTLNNELINTNSNFYYSTTNINLVVITIRN